MKFAGNSWASKNRILTKLIAPKLVRSTKLEIFTSEASRKRFHEAVDKHQVFILERSFLIEQGVRHWFLSPLQYHPWTRFCAPWEPAAVIVIREFYANASEHHHGRVNVRGPFSMQQLVRMMDFSSLD
ncbi:hypothetical protein MLD38_025384 [Melastoma candidum]|uniref:Uncharacterized protein n=1 Tax=Melastoma candidum TaxID=119954 RepID=A0ACB9NY30_9MYRT|nr:hypothetical protein MLD38_025384 [Melastoma candidum]